MAYKFLDAKLGWTYPSTSGLKYFRADGTWVKPSGSYKFINALNQWSVPTMSRPTKPTTEAAFRNLSWSQLTALSNDCALYGTSGYTSMLGWCTYINTSQYGDIDLQLVALNKNRDTSNNVIGFTFMSKPVVTNTLSAMGSDANKETLYNNSFGRTWANTTMYSMFSAEAKAAIRPISLKMNTSANAKSSTTTTLSGEKVWLPSGRELFGDYYYGDEGSPFDYNDWKKKLLSTGEAFSYWLRTPCKYGSNYGFYYVTTRGLGGNAYNSPTPITSVGYVFCLCI